MSHLEGDTRKLVSRVRRIKGQLEAVERGLIEGRDCYEVLQTLSACRGGMNGLMGFLVEEHVKEHIMSDKDNPKSSQDKSSLELIKLMKTYWK